MIIVVNKKIVSSEMVKDCVIKNCRSFWYPNTDLSFHCFPFKNPELLDKWLQAIPSELIKTPIKHYYCICSKHFSPESYIPTSYKNQLLKNAVPTIFDEHEYDSMEVLSESTENSIDNTLNNESYYSPQSINDHLNIIEDNEKTKEIISYQLPSQLNKTSNIVQYNEKTKEPIKRHNVKDISVQTELKRLKPLEDEENLRRTIKSLRSRLNRRDDKIKSLQELVAALKKHMAGLECKSVNCIQ